MNQNDHKVGLLYILIVIASVAYSPASRGEIASEYLLLPSIGANFRSGLANDSLFKSDHYKYGVDVFVTSKYRNFLFLGELLLDNHEQTIERIQLGWTAGDTKIWLGRFHNPVGYWNTQYHHGAYLETSISRPSIVEFEHDDGILPVHLTGLLVEGVIEHDNQGLGYALAVAVGPELTDELEAMDILDPGSGSQDLSVTLNLYHEPVLYAQTRYGVSVNYTEIPAVNAGLIDIHQTIAGAYGHWTSHRWRLTGSTFYVHNRLNRLSGELTDHFIGGYFQAEYNLDERWTFFGRAEWTSGNQNDAYLALFPKHISDRILAGVRLEFLNRHALKLEASGNRSKGDNFGQFMLQWVAMF